MLKATVFYVYMERNRFFFKISTKKKQNKKEQNMTRKERKTRDDTRRDKMKPDNGKEVYLLVKKALK